MLKLRLNLLYLIWVLSLPGCLGGQTVNAWPLPDYYHTLSKIDAEIRELDAKYPELVHWEIIGTTYTDHLPLYAVKLSVNADRERLDIPSVLFVGQHHGEEIIGVEIVMYEMKQLLTLYGKDLQITSILENNEVWFVPTVNPEGYNFVSRSFFPFRRKNNTDTNMNGRLDLYEGGDGVDLNKSYDFNWENDAGTDPLEFYYKGPFPASEAETIAMQHFFEREKFSYAILYHSSITGNFSERIYFSWNWNGLKSPDHQDMKGLATQISKHLPRDYAPGNYRVHTGTTSPIGFARDYLYANYNTFAYDVETCGVYQNGISIVRPFKPMYDKILEKHFEGLLELFRQSELHTFRGRILNEDGEPVRQANITYPDRHSPFQRAIHTNADGYFFRYLDEEDLDFTINLKYHFRTNRQARHADYILPIPAEPGFAGNPDAEGILYRNPSATFRFPDISHWQTKTTLELNFFDQLNWIDSRSEVISSDSITWRIPALVQTTQGELRYYLFHKGRITDKRTQEYVVHNRSDSTLSWCADVSGIADFPLNPRNALGVKYNFRDKSKSVLKIKGIRVHGDSDGTLLYLKIRDEKTNRDILHQELKAIGRNGIITVFFPAVTIPNAAFLSLENLSDKMWKIKVESSIQPCSHQNYIRYDEWQKADTRDFAIELITE